MTETKHFIHALSESAKRLDTWWHTHRVSAFWKSCHLGLRLHATDGATPTHHTILWDRLASHNDPASLLEAAESHVMAIGDYQPLEGDQ